MGLVVSLLLAACSEFSESAEVDHSAVAEAELLEAGTDPDVAACVTRIGSRDLRVGPLSEAAMDELLTNCQAAHDVINGVDPESDPDGSLAMTDEIGTDEVGAGEAGTPSCLLYTSPSPRDATLSRMPSSA